MANKRVDEFAAAPLPVTLADVLPIVPSATPTVAKQATLGDVYNKFNYDSGWLDLEGFAFITTSAERPKVRQIGRNIYFKGLAIVPLDNAGLVSYVNQGSYIGVASVSAYTGAGGVIAASSGLAYNNGTSVLPVGIDMPDSTYEVISKICNRYIDDSLGNAIYYTTVCNIYLSNTGVLSVSTIGAFGDTPQATLLNLISSNVVTGDTVMDFRTVTGVGNGNTLQGNTLVGSKIVTYDTDASGGTHQVTMDASSGTNLGGFEIPIDELVAHTAILT